MPLLDLFWTILYIFLLVVWIWLLIVVFSDIFRSDMSGWGKAGWTIFVILLPLLGVLVYLIAHGGDMQDRSARDAIAVEQAQRDYIRSAAGTSVSTADELSKLAALRDTGVISDGEFDAQKAKLLA
jgi:Short C-terminal domain/Phospholipase_D-nuclease N-terminal